MEGRESLNSYRLQLSGLQHHKSAQKSESGLLSVRPKIMQRVVLTTYS